MSYCLNLDRLRTIGKSIATSVVFLATGCATQAPPIALKEAPQSTASQKAAQQAIASGARQGSCRLGHAANG